jgi:hypothetical protein
MYLPGCLLGSLLGGRFSDRELARRTAGNGGKMYAEVSYSDIVQQDHALTTSISYVCKATYTVFSCFLCSSLALGGSVKSTCMSLQFVLCYFSAGFFQCTMIAS